MKNRIAVVIPCYKVKNHIHTLLKAIGDSVWRIYVVDDACPEFSGKYVLSVNTDTRVRVIFNEKNLGVGGAVLAGYLSAIEDGAQVIVKIDGDGQMDPLLLPLFIDPIARGEADYCKGNRFFNLDQIGVMPKTRIFGNAILSFMTKISSGYWDIFDPTNGFTAIHAGVAKNLPFHKISKRYFFETDMLFRLNVIKAVVVDIPMDAKYDGAESNLSIKKIIGEFMYKHTRNFVKRIFYNYYLRDLSLASIELPIGLLLLIIGGIFGLMEWIYSAREGINTPAGTVMLAALPILMGIQLILAFLGADIASIPRRPRQRDLQNIPMKIVDQV